jgi:hypothetical protein
VVVKTAAKDVWFTLPNGERINAADAGKRAGVLEATMMRRLREGCPASRILSGL